MKTDKVNVDGRQVTAEFSTEEQARLAAARIDRDRITSEGTGAEKIDQVFDAIESWADNLSRPQMGVLGWVLAFVAGVMAWFAFGRLMPIFDMLFGLVGVVVVLLMKIGAARWAKAKNVGNEEMVNTYRLMTFGAAFLILLVSVAFQAAVNKDVETGIASTESQVEREDRAISRAEFDASQMQRPSDASDILRMEIDQRLAVSAVNNAGTPAGFTIGQAIGAGVRNEKGLQPETFCMPNRQRQTYIDQFCPDLVDMEKGLQRRLAYEAVLADIAARKVANDLARKQVPLKGSSLILGEEAAAEGGNTQGSLLAIVIASVLMLFVELGCIFCVYISKRHPKGVTQAVAQLSTVNARAP